VPAHVQVVARRDERRLKVLDSRVQRPELETREAGSEQTLRLERPVFPFFRQQPESALERAERTLIVAHGEAQTRRGRVCYRKLPLDVRVLGFLVRRLEHANRTIGALDGELDVADALADESEQVEGGRIIRALF
jgi:hypothetical protein